MKTSIVIAFSFLLVSCSTKPQKEDHQIINVFKTDKAFVIDGKDSESFWEQCSWYTIDQNWLGNTYSQDDFFGRYKLSWNDNALLILVEITDDNLYSPYKDPLKLWWNNDCLEILVDEDNSGGLHQNNDNAFDYYLGLDGNITDVNCNKKPELYNKHITYKRVSENKLSTWEIAIKFYKEGFGSIPGYTMENLRKNKKIGFALAYCDNDNSTERENTIGSVYVPGENKNQGWINADIFGTIILKE